jgi:hypothetical protein
MHLSSFLPDPMTLREKGEQIMNWIKDLNKAKLKVISNTWPTELLMFGYRSVLLLNYHTIAQTMC